ncbi:12430_t:CDS:10, partial [Gigaspora rosea]
PANWSILDFLNESDEEPFSLKIDFYIKSLENIADTEQGSRKKSARKKWRERRLSGSPVIQGFSLSHETGVGAQLTYLMQKASRRSSTGPTGTQVAFWSPQTDRKKAKEWEDKRSHRQVNIHKKIIGNGNVIGVVGNVNNSKVSVAEPSLKKRDQEGKDDDKVLKRTKSIDRAENIDDGEVDPDYNEDDYSNYDIDPNIELSEEQIPVQSHLKYPDKDSPDDFWVLPSGKSIDIIIRIIRIGSKIRKPEWIEQKDWDYLNSSVDYPHYDLSTEIEDLFIILLDTCLYNITFDHENDIEMIFVTDVLLWFAKNVFNTTSTFHSINKNEALLGSLMIHPVLQYLVNATKHVIYVPGEIYLKASANQRLLRRNLKPDDDKPLGMKVDGSFQFPDERGLEIGMVELSGGYLTNDLPRYLKDHVKGYWGCRDLLNDVITNFNHGDYKILRRLRVWFFHVHGLEVQIWGMDLPVSKVYRMFLMGTFQFPISWENHHELVHALRVLQNFRRGLDDTLKVLEEFKRSHRRNTLLRFQSIALKNYIGDAKSSPQKPTGKKSRIINPVEHHMHHDHDDSDYDDPPSPSPSGHSRYPHQLNSD